MSRRLGLATLAAAIACSCGAPTPRDAKPLVRSNGPAESKQVDNTTDKNPPKNDSKPDVDPEIGKEPVFTPTKTTLPARKFTPVLESTARYGKSPSNIVRVTLVGADTSPIDKKNRKLTVRFQVKNEGIPRTTFEPWGMAGSATARDEHGNDFAFIPIAIKTEPAPFHWKDVIVASVSFECPRPESQELDVKLAGDNAECKGQWFTFKIGREQFAKDEDEVRAKKEHESQLAKFAAEHKAWKERKEKIEAARLAKIESARAAKALDEAFAELRKPSAPAAPKITYENYDKIYNGMSLESVRAILGSERSKSDIGDTSTLMWKTNNQLFQDRVITVTFKGGAVVSKTIIP